MIYIITGAFMVLDMITGLVKAFAEKNYTSSVMREGLIHKVAEILCVVMAILVNEAQNYIDLGVTVPIIPAVCGYIILMEIGSNIENLGTVNQGIVPEKIRSYFKKL